MASSGYEAQYKKMTQTPIPKLVLTLGLPTVISTLVTNIYNLADTYFVSGLGISQSGATGVVFALMGIIQAIGFMFGHGAGSNISRAQGAGKMDVAWRYSATTFYVGNSVGIILMAAGLIFEEPLMRVLGSTTSILPYAMEYGIYILVGAPALITSLILSVIERYEGKAIFAMIGMGSGGVINIFGDWLLVNVCGLGITGAGISTCVSEYIGMIILFIPFARHQVQSTLKPKYLTLHGPYIPRILAVGAPSLLRQSLNSVSALTLNHCAALWGGDAAIAAMSIVTRAQTFMFSIALGVGQGFQPVSAFNYGAGKYSRVKKGFWFTTGFNIMIMAIAGIFGAIFAQPLVMMFRDDPEVLEIGVFAMRLASLSLPFLAVTVVSNMLFQSLGQAKTAILLAGFRSGLFFVPFVLILSAIFGVTGLQIAQPVADVVACLASIPFFVPFLRKMPADTESVEKGQN